MKNNNNNKKKVKFPSDPKRVPVSSHRSPEKKY
jgi:hypothetical protein